jgi:isoleucyl-tRNA synthetase
MYRRFRNTLRFLLGALDGWQPPATEIPYDQLPVLEKVVLDALFWCQSYSANGTDHGKFDWSDSVHHLHNFCAVDLSAFYFDVRKDVLYCDGADSSTRQASLQTLATIFDHLVSCLAPVLVFTAEEAWLMRYPHGKKTAGGDTITSVHLTVWSKLPDLTQNSHLTAIKPMLMKLRSVMLGGLEQARQQKLIGSSLQAKITLYLARQEMDRFFYDLLDKLDLAEIAIVSAAEISRDPAPAEAFRLSDVPYAAVVVTQAEGEKCNRCWKVLVEVGSVAAHPDLCHRCADVVTGLEAA